MTRMKSTNRLLMLGLLPAVLSGCISLAPDYEQPMSPVSEQWPASPGMTGDGGRSVTDISWEQLIADAQLRELVTMALDNNRDLRVAALNIESARARYRIQRSALVPEVGVSAAQDAERALGSVSRLYSTGVGISSYELDLFGRVRNLKDAALESYLGLEQTHRSFHISLISEVAATYLTLVSDLELSQLAQSTLQSRQREYDLQLEKYAAGTGSQLTLRQAEEMLEAARVDVLGLDSAIATDRNALELLVGAPLPASLPTSVDGSLDTILGLSDIPAGLPSDLLLNRPDIRAAEHGLLAANANIGAARAAFFPTITLTGSVGRASEDLSNLFDGGGRNWTFMPQLYLPIFSGGRLQAELDVTKIESEISVAEYERSIQSAFREVADALAVQGVVGNQLSAQQKRTDAAQAAHDLVKIRYDNGVASYLDVLDAQRTLYSAQQLLIQTKLTQKSNLVTLYKALGGGWTAVDAGAMAGLRDLSSVQVAQSPRD